MNRQEYILNQLMEEAAEVIQACSKFKRFGASGWGPRLGTPADELRKEVCDFLAVIELCEEEGIITGFGTDSINAIEEKKKKLGQYIEAHGA